MLSASFQVAKWISPVVLYSTIASFGPSSGWTTWQSSQVLAPSPVIVWAV